MSNKIKVIDNFLDEKTMESIESVLTSYKFPWNFYPDAVNGDELSDNRDINLAQFAHLFQCELEVNQTTFRMISPLIDKINPRALIRTKANLQLKSDNPVQNGMHTDFEYGSECKSAVFYVNDNNGYTLFKDGQYVMSKRNRILIFDTDIEHAAVTCSDKLYRLVININYF